MNTNEIELVVRNAVKAELAEYRKSQYFETMKILSEYGRQLYTNTFYNPAISSFGMALSASKASVQIFITPPIDKNLRGFAKPGEKRYDHDNCFFFGLTLHECFLITKNFDDILNSRWIRPNVTDEKYKYNMEFQHETRKFSIGPVLDRNQHPTLKASIYDSDKKGFISYIFRTDNGELELFKSYIQNSLLLLPFSISVVDGLIKTFKSSLYNSNNNVISSKNNQESSSESVPLSEEETTAQLVSESENNNPPFEQTNNTIQPTWGNSESIPDSFFSSAPWAAQTTPSENVEPKQQNNTPPQVTNTNSDDWNF